MSIEHRTSFENAFLSQISFEKFVEKVFPKNCSKDCLTNSAIRLEKAVGEALKKLSLLPNAQTLDILPSRSYMKAFLKKDEKEIRLLCFPSKSEDWVDPLVRSNGLDELVGSEAVLSLDSGEISSHITHLERGNAEMFEQEMRGRALLQEKIPDFYRRIPPIFRYDYSSFALASKEPYHKTLSNELNNNRFSLSASQFLKVLQQVLSEVKTLGDHGLVYSYLNPNSIAISRRNDQVTGHLNEFIYLTPQKGPCSATHSWMNPLAYENFASRDTDLCGLVQVMATMFSLQFSASDSWDVEKQEMCALSTVDKQISPVHYEKIIELKAQHRGFHKGFSKALLQYVDGLKIQEEEGFQIAILEQFAEKMALFPQVSSLLKKVIEVNAEQKKRLKNGELPITIDATGPHMPSLKKIQEVLRQGERVLKELRNSRQAVPTEILQVDKDHIRQIVTHMSIDPSFIEIYTDQFHQQLSQYLQERPTAGSEKRFHKKPFSFRVCVGLKRIFIYPIGSFLGGGNYKTAKKSWCAEISSNGIFIEKQLLSRSRKKYPEDVAMHQAILQIPEADKYFVDLPKRHRGYLGSNGKMKWESNRSLYGNNLEEVIAQQGIYIDPLDASTFQPLTMLDFISFLESISQGISLITQHQISHGDVKSDNIGIFVTPDKSCIARMTDFDLTSYFTSEESNDSNMYRFWDHDRNSYGKISAKTDLYGLVLLVAEVFLFGLQERLSSESDEHIHEFFQNIWRSPEEAKKEFLANQEKSLNKIGLILNKQVSRKNCVAALKKIASWQNTEKHQRSIALKIWLAKALCFERVFSLLEYTLKADQDKLQEGGLVSYPTIEEVQRVLDECKQDVVWLNEQCEKYAEVSV